MLADRSRASQPKRSQKPYAADAKEPGNSDQNLSLAFAQDDGSRQGRGRKKRRVKEDEPAPASKGAPANEATKATPASPNQKSAKPPANAGPPQPPALQGPKTVTTPQESLTWFSIRLVDRIGARLTGRTAPVAKSAPQGSPNQNANKGDSAAKLEKKGPVGQNKGNKAKTATAQRGPKKSGGVQVIQGPNGETITIDPKKIRKSGFSKGDKKKR
jgi:hypothetical protein